MAHRYKISYTFALCRKNETTLNRGCTQNVITDRVRTDFPAFFQPLPIIDRIHKNIKITHQLSQDILLSSVLHELTLPRDNDSPNMNPTSVSPTTPTTICARIQRVTSEKPILVLDLDETLVQAVLERPFITMKSEPFVELTSETRHSVGAREIRMIKPTAVHINTARGAIINERELLECMKEGVIAGAGLDTQEVEPPVPGSELWSLPNVFMTPHIGWRRLETRQRLVNMTARNIGAYIQGKLINIVN